jgi:hypothetical protein
MPKVPPRPRRTSDRSVSPGRDTFARSPFQEGGFSVPTRVRTNDSDLDVPIRPPSVNLPSIGHEGDEYGSIMESISRTTSHDITQKPHIQSIGSDIKLHAPKPTLPASSAKAKTAAVTGTDTPTAEAAGIGSSYLDGKARSIRKKSSFMSNHSTTSDGRRRSIIEDFTDEQGIPEIGMRVPMSPFAGDVQAPVGNAQPPPSFSTSHLAGRPPSAHGQGRHHGRTPSGREFFGPPGSYGLHGHGTHTVSKFERAWQEKHHETNDGEYAPSAVLPRKEWVLSSDDLNKAVRGTASRGAGKIFSSFYLLYKELPTELIC